MKRIFIIATLIASIFLLASCKEKATDSLTIANITAGRKDAYVELDLKNNDKTIDESSIVGDVYLDDAKVNTFKVTIEKDEDDEDIKNYTISVTGLAVDKTYRIEITALVNKVRKTLAKQTFKTISIGGTEEDPKLISTIQEFLDIEKDDTAYYRLTADLDFSDYDYKTIFNTASRDFKGVFDGDGHKIKNVTLDERTTYSGLIGRNSGTIKNLVVENFKVDFTKSSTYSQYTSLLVGRNVGKIDNVTVSGQIELKFNTSVEINVGGIAGVMESNGSITNSEVDIEVVSEVTARTIFNIGGIVGKLREGLVEDTTVKADISVTSAEALNIGGAFGKVEYNNKIKADKVSVDSKIEIKTKVTATTKDKTIILAVGGFAGTVNDSKFENVFTKTNITFNEPVITKPADVSSTNIYVGGLVGISNNITLNESVVEGTITLEKHEENENINFKFDKLYLGGLVGETQNGRFGKVLNNGLVVNFETIAKTGKVNPLFGREVNSKISNYAHLDYQVSIDGNNEQKELEYSYETNYRVNLDYGFTTDAQTEYFISAFNTLTKPQNPKRDNYKFLGWYLGNKPFDFSTKITSNLNLKALWKEKTAKYYVGFDLGYETLEVVDPIMLLESEIITEPIPTRVGYEFKGWFLKANDTEAFDFEHAITSDTIFVAKWELEDGETESFNVVFEVGYDSDEATLKLYVEKGNKITAPADPVRVGYELKGWYLNGILFDFDEEVKEDLILVANWYKLETDNVSNSVIDIETWFVSEWIKDKLN